MQNTETLTSNRSTSAIEAKSGSGSTLDSIKETVADKLKTAADTIQQRAGQNSTVSGYGNQAAEWLNRSADYIKDIDPQQVKTDVQNEVRRNPGRSLLIAGAVGLVLGVLIRR
jgi:ElaB/YqjD/DUF883 family membrane-anchored ribosome-binding protein